MAQLMPMPLTVSCSNKIQIGFTFLVPAHPGSPGKRAVKRVCVCVCGLVTKYSVNCKRKKSNTKNNKCVQNVLHLSKYALQSVNAVVIELASLVTLCELVSAFVRRYCTLATNNIVDCFEISRNPLSRASFIGSIDSPLSSSITPHSFFPSLKLFFSANPSYCSLPFLLQD